MVDYFASAREISSLKANMDNSHDKSLVDFSNILIDDRVKQFDQIIVIQDKLVQEVKGVIGVLEDLDNMSKQQTGSAEEDRIVEQNQYNEKDIELQTEYFHEGSLLEKKKSLPEELKALTFEPERYNFYETVERTLFQSSSSENNTIQAKADQLELFTSNERQYTGSNNTEQKNSFSFDLTLLLGIIAVVAVLCLFLILVPKMSKGEKPGKARTK